jgi:methylglutaconyl-CoA hydratase
MSFSFLTVRRDGAVEYVTLSRPDVRNALNDVMIGELTAWAEAARSDTSLRVAVIAGAGAHFCAGGDIAWMRRMGNAGEIENREDARRLAAMFNALDTLHVALVGRVHGAAIGGGTGLAAVCDVVVASATAVFGFSEVRLGIVPAVIAPFALAKIGPAAGRDLFLTGSRFSAERARELGLVHAVVPEDSLDDTVAKYVRELLLAAPGAIATAKALIREIAWQLPSDVAELTIDTIARQRTSAEGQEGLSAFLEKRQPSWAE